MSEQAANLARVHSKIAPVIVDFCAGRSQFHMEQLTAYVRERVVTSPDSPSRILRALRLQGVIDYRVLNRRASLYEILPIAVAA